MENINPKRSVPKSFKTEASKHSELGSIKVKHQTVRGQLE
jgi:hypothetical protein